MVHQKTEHTTTYLQQARATGKHGVEEACALLDPDNELTLVFLSSDYEASAASAYLSEYFSGRVIGCTTAGVVGADGFERHGVSAVGFSSGMFMSKTWCFDSLYDVSERIAEIQSYTEALSKQNTHGLNIFGVFLIDGLSKREEWLVAELFAALGDIPIVGGSAGDDLEFQATRVLFDGELRTGIATFTLIQAACPISIVKFQHHEPTAKRLVITSADPDERLVHEINGMKAVDAYARLVGLDRESLARNPQTFSTHPLMLRAGDRYYLRSIQQIEEDGSLRFFCAIDQGLVLRLGTSGHMLEALRAELEKLDEKVGGAELILVFDCILRRMEFEQHGIDDAVGQLLSKHHVVGFSTYGEQCDALHVNQTMVGVAFGRMP
jgi:hypothetical protein